MPFKSKARCEWSARLPWLGALGLRVSRRQWRAGKEGEHYAGLRDVEGRTNNANLRHPGRRALEHLNKPGEGSRKARLGRLRQAALLPDSLLAFTALRTMRATHGNPFRAGDA